MKKNFPFILTVITVIIFVLNSQIVLEGASSGLILWFKTIVPTLFPFALLSSILLDLNMESAISRLLSPVTRPVFGISPAGNYVLFIGLLCGYPLGARTASTLIREGRLSNGEGQYLMNFCNNLSPAFIISFVCGSLLNDSSLIPKMLITLYLTPVLLGILSRHIYISRNITTIPETCSCSLPEHYCHNRSTLTVKPSVNIISILDKAITTSSETLLKLGAYIIIFAILSNLIEHSIIPEYLKLILTSITEVTGGCRIIATSAISTKLKLSLLSSLITFGGIAGIAQTAGMLHNTNLSLKQYIIFRTISAAVVFIITYIFF
ncbi:MAG: hypothetical protein J6B39_03845 [Lachnospiraceae bacterium]|nr:hypothetical protein [Lachnospiraceae bacterium]